MAVYLSKATGNLTDATATWGTVDATSYLNAETAAHTVTTAFNGTRTAAFTPGAITVDGIALKLCNRTGTTGTISVHLADNATHTEVPGTLVTINCSDLPAAVQADINGGWIFFKFGSGVLLVVATAYEVEVNTSSATQVTLWRDSTAANVSRCLRTTTEAAPGAGDDIIVTKQWTAAATGTAVTITIDQTAATDYGAASTSLILPAVAVTNGGTLKSGTTASTNYVYKVSGNIIVYAGGELDFGTTGTPVPRNSSFTLTLDSGTAVDFGIIIRNLGTFVSQGLSRTAAKLIDRCLLNTDEAVNSTDLGVDTDTGWLDNDAIAVATTTRTAAQCESGLMNGNAGASSLTVDGFAGAGGGLAFAHSGTSPTQAEVVLLTRNVVITGASTTLTGYVDIKPTAAVDCDWTEFKFLGSGNTNKRGIDFAGTTGVQTLNRCSFHDFTPSSAGIFHSAASGTAFVLSDSIFFNMYGTLFQWSNASTGTWILDNNIFMRTTGDRCVTLNDIGGTFTNNTIVGSATVGMVANETAVTAGTFSGFNCHGNASTGLSYSVPGGDATITGTNKMWRNSSSGLNISGGDFTVNNLEAFGNSSENIGSNLPGVRCVLNSPVLSGDTTFSTANGINMNSNNFMGIFIINSGDFGTATGIKVAHSTADIAISQTSYLSFQLNNTKLASATEFVQASFLGATAFLSSEKHDQTAGNHKKQFRVGLLTIDTTIFDVTPSLRMAPTSATNKFRVTVGRVNVNSGQTVTPTIKVRESVVGDGTAYNGNRIRLLVLRNDSLGILADTVLATATVSSVGAFESISGATAAVNDDGQLAFAIDCDGTTGWINADTLSAVVA